ncbi:DNA replication and repair protein RecF [Leptospira fainei serovar Hurstbridge str. BUT 6]|uniref:DNA replication and repair protein RecF n=1 Tax=Leptospira fainei serovar Hurstbridge str. BUT 6 TaxID=1193011 RepID=S3UVA0_9LEPT|nr:DNA replication/repair protein RecF [Leptospira fainei]EPG73183.1 DNA replication and repair protein RecF [Leptospira fainei serovar Hurstbridge str. BUT 6]
MFLRSLRLLNFRNHESISLDFDSRLIFFVGENGEGKTNLLEAISIVSWLKSFRESEDGNLVRWNEDSFYIKAEIESDRKKDIIEIGYSKKPAIRRKLKFNQEEIKKRSDLVGKFITVLMTPLDLQIVEGGPVERRRFLDSFLSSFDRSYLDDLIEYNKILKHRNALLKSGSRDAGLYSVWDSKLVAKGGILHRKRKNLIQELDILYQTNLTQLSGGKDDFQLRYKPSFHDEQEFESLLIRNLSRDQRLGYTSVGIHRDDLFIGAKDMDITDFASQGQKRSTVISLKAASFEYYRKFLKITPVLLIDDVIRELDVKRREYFVELVLNAGQAFFTTTDLEGISDYVGRLQDRKQVFLVRNGEVQAIDG